MNLGHPNVVNHWLAEGKCDIAPCSSVCLLSKPDFEMALPLGVSTNGVVKSVYLGLHLEHEYVRERIEQCRSSIQELFRQGQSLFKHDCRKTARHVWNNLEQLPRPSTIHAPPVKLSSASASGGALTKLIYRMLFGREAYNTQVNRNFAHEFSGSKPIELLIGDEALTRKRQFYTTIDLGLLWRDLTGLPFVFAVWQSKGACLNGWRRKILAAGELAESKMRVDPSSYLPDRLPTDESGKTINLADYWKIIDYRLGVSQFRGLMVFLCLIQHLQGLPLGEALAVKLMRWQEISQTGTIPQP